MDPVAKRPSIRDVAARAGVSYQTVSRAMNGHSSIRDSTKHRILQAIDELGYQPNEAARTLVRGATKTIGLLTMPTTDYGPQSQAIAIERAADDAGYRIALTNARSYDVADISASIDFLQGRQIDALVVQAAVTSMFDALRTLTIRVPYVTLEPTGLAFGHSVAIDQLRGAQLAMDHLIDHGHRRIAHLRGPESSIEANARARAYTERMASIGAPVVMERGDWSADSGYAVGARLLDELDVHGCTAVFSANDQMAIGILHAARDRGIRVPEDLSIVGFDDVPEAGHLAPPLTTVRQEFAKVGERAVQVLLDELGGKRGLVHARIAPELIERSSVARVW